MKDSLFEMLLTLFEKTLTHLKESQLEYSASEAEQQTLAEHCASPIVISRADLYPEYIKTAQNNSMRVYTYDEQTKFTKASYQFLMRMSSLGVIAPDSLELIINQMLFSESRFVTLQETKWVIRNTLAESLDAEQLAFLDLVLYQTEDKLPLH